MSSAESTHGTIDNSDNPAWHIEVTANGPYVVKESTAAHRTATIQFDTNGTSTAYALGDSQEFAPETRLCRCGDSAKKPFCDGSHERTTALLEETAAQNPYSSNPDVIAGPELTLHDDESLCSFARFCDAGERVWTEVTRFGEKHTELVDHVAKSCPGGRLLTYSTATGELISTSQAEGIYSIDDPKLGVYGPLMVAGGATVISSSGAPYAVRASQALCRCGRSSNKPFCDGSHASTG